MLRTERIGETDRGFLIDPFAAMPDAASRVAGVRGGDAVGEPGYVFRTLPVLPVPGPTEFRLRLDGLHADAGSLSIDLTTTAAAGDAAPVKVRTLVVPLAELATGDGSVAVPFEARRDTLYAVAGYVHDDAPVAARALTVELRATSREAVRSTIELARASVEPVAQPRLTSIVDPDFGDPVSQPMTTSQLRHRDFRRWADALRREGAAGDDSLWAQAFVLQALDRYGMLRVGTRGLDLGPAAAALGARMRAVGGVAAVDQPAGSDVVWSIDVAAGPQDLDRAIWRGLDRLKPGGLAVHVFALGAAAVARSHVERLALNLISHGHEVAQLKFGVRSGDRMLQREKNPFGLIWRRTLAG